MKYKQLKEKVEARKTRGKWSEAVKAYMLECLEIAEYCGISEETNTANITLADLMNHVGGRSIKMGMFHSEAARNIIQEASEGGNFLIYNGDIAERFLTPSGLKRQTRKDGYIAPPRSSESWIEIQTRCLTHAVWEIQATAAGRRV